MVENGDTVCLVERNHINAAAPVVVPVASSAPVRHKLPIKRLMLSHKFKPLKTLFNLRILHPKTKPTLSAIQPDTNRIVQ